jgi:hypothetical protein
MPELVIGIIAALYIYERIGISPGGIITAGFVALYSGHWEFALCTLLVAAAAAFLVRLLSRWMVLYGKRLFAVCVLMGLGLSMAVASFSGPYAGSREFAVIGHIIPGLIAKDMLGQGAAPTLAALALAVGVTRIAVFAGRGWVW